jgi:hypothetical protein
MSIAVEHQRARLAAIIEDSHIVTIIMVTGKLRAAAISLGVVS